MKISKSTSNSRCPNNELNRDDDIKRKTIIRNTIKLMFIIISFKIHCNRVLKYYNNNFHNNKFPLQ